MSYIKIENLKKVYIIGENEIIANNDINFEINKGEFVVILGSSGAGKSTLLNILGGMDVADSGNIFIDNKNIAKYTKEELTKYRRNDVGFVFQFYNLLPNLTAKENVELASELVEKDIDIIEVLKDVGLENRMNNFPSQLSGGEQQRVSIARAIAKSPKILLCDEPTGALDFNTGKQVLNILSNLSSKKNVTVIVVTHNSEIAKIADKVIYMQDAKVKEILINKNKLNVSEIKW
ncbi:ABC transporter ATP-binding protein [Streptobacillus moniliformis]|uniref:ABC transporter related protein n=1 Tax=Streptobacillus moniliformis (strain ATCC 14647 / DSM 12112 / NCTC 10651 / 9901) TaxID=519441 RepID=D1AXL6_STRM9|nr:ABC transporter ATP-binding protein [Streptobacillus moniliformis]ACZ01042.1 ABC transporter related protein [Streptobacillus moniliformis DSM 12112]AVL42590.1 ABC transporter ATP-binding protein [Streptobacillus moniliformis]SQA13819.1 Macrolide export ATP-binding/permease protein MacB [Streptobacillus moniliformis]